VTSSAAVEFEAFRPELNAALTYSDGTQGGRPPFDPVNGPNNFTWHGSADNAYDARAQGWSAWLDEVTKDENEGP
jgi:hypothetical protein